MKTIHHMLVRKFPKLYNLGMILYPWVKLARQDIQRRSGATMVVGSVCPHCKLPHVACLRLVDYESKHQHTKYICTTYNCGWWDWSF